MKAEIETGNGQTIEIDTSEMEKRLIEKLGAENKAVAEKYFEKLKETREEKGSKGIVEAFAPEKKAALLEEFKKGDKLDHHKINEQWTICVPKYATAELAGHLRDFVWVTDAVKGKAGEDVNIPIVKDLDFATVTPKTGTFTATTGLINVVTTTLKEAGAYYDAYYGDIEKIDSNMLDELNRVFAHAAIRAEDRELIALINSATSGLFRSYGGGTSSLSPLFVGTNASAFNANFIVDALAALMNRGKDVSPGECILYLNNKLWKALVKQVIGSTPMGAAKADAITTGMLESLIGVKIVVGGKQAKWHCNQVAISSYEHAYLMRPKRALAMAPKRDILIETDKLIATRQLRIAGSHTFGVKLLDATEIVPIVSGSAISA
jgi:hypothetical protein